MEQTQSTQENSVSKQLHLLQRDDVREKFKELLGKRTNAFLTSVMACVTSNELLKKADQNSIYMAAMTAASLDLPINQNLGFSYIIPYNKKQEDGTYKQFAQFQIGYKGYIQLCLRTGRFKTISACPVYEGQLVSSNPLTGYVFDFSKNVSTKVIGYASHFSLIEGFEKTDFKTIEELTKHGLRFSQTFKKGYGLWKDDFDSMAIKTVLKLLLSKYAPMSVEMITAVTADQSVINNYETMDVDYVDAETGEITKNPLEEVLQEKIEVKLSEPIVSKKEKQNTKLDLK